MGAVLSFLGITGLTELLISIGFVEVDTLLETIALSELSAIASVESYAATAGIFNAYDAIIVYNLTASGTFAAAGLAALGGGIIIGSVFALVPNYQIENTSFNQILQQEPLICLLNRDGKCHGLSKVSRKRKMRVQNRKTSHKSVLPNAKKVRVARPRLKNGNKGRKTSKRRKVSKSVK